MTIRQSKPDYIEGAHEVAGQFRDIQLKALVDTKTAIQANMDVICQSPALFALSISTVINMGLIAQKDIAEKLKLSTAAVGRWASAQNCPPVYGRGPILKTIVETLDGKIKTLNLRP